LFLNKLNLKIYNNFKYKHKKKIKYKYFLNLVKKLNTSYLYQLYKKNSYNNTTFNYTNKTVSNLIPLTNRIIQKTLYTYFFNIRKINYINKIKLNIYFRDFNKKPYWKFREARLVNWNLYKNNKINKRKYSNFLLPKLKKQNNNVPYIIISLLSNIYIPQLQLERINNNFLKNFILYKDNIKLIIFKQPYYLNRFINWNLLKFKENLIDKKIKKSSYINFKKKIMPWLEKKKKNPTYLIFKKSNISKFFSSYLFIDHSINAGFIYKNLSLNYIPFNQFSKLNYVLKLNTYRYQP